MQMWEINISSAEVEAEATLKGGRFRVDLCLTEVVTFPDHYPCLKKNIQKDITTHLGRTSIIATIYREPGFGNEAAPCCHRLLLINVIHI